MSAAPADILEWFKTTYPQQECGMFIVYYRGSWWGWCKTSVRKYSELADELKGKGVSLYGVTASSQEETDSLIKELGIKFPIYSDPEHKLRDYLAEQELIKVCVTGGPDSKNKFYRELKYFAHYPKGVAQPAVLFVNKEGSNIFAWAQQPCVINLHGALGRPEPEDVWKKVQEKLSSS